MSKIIPEEDVKSNYISKMGVDLGTPYFALWKEIANLYDTWSEYVALYGTDKTSVKEMNIVAPYYFGLIQNVLWENVILHIARITDSCTTSGKANLTVQQLPGLIDNTELRTEVDTVVKEARAKSLFCRDWRNRHIAHTDLSLAIKEDAEPLGFASRLKVKEALSSIADVFNIVGRGYSCPTVIFDLQNSEPGGALSLMKVVKKAAKDKLEKPNRAKV